MESVKEPKAWHSHRVRSTSRAEAVRETICALNAPRVIGKRLQKSDDPTSVSNISQYAGCITVEDFSVSLDDRKDKSFWRAGIAGLTSGHMSLILLSGVSDWDSRTPSSH